MDVNLIIYFLFNIILIIGQNDSVYLLMYLTVLSAIMNIMSAPDLKFL